MDFMESRPDHLPSEGFKDNNVTKESNFRCGAPRWYCRCNECRTLPHYLGLKLEPERGNKESRGKALPAPAPHTTRRTPRLTFLSCKLALESEHPKLQGFRTGCLPGEGKTGAICLKMSSGLHPDGFGEFEDPSGRGRYLEYPSPN